MESVLLLDISGAADGRLTACLTARGLRIEVVRDIESALLAIEHEAADAIVYPTTDFHAEATCRSLRGCIGSPIVAIVDDADELSVVRLLRAGADAVLPRTLPRGELDARLDALSGRARSARGAPRPADARKIGDLVIDESSHVARRAGEAIALSPTEFRLLSALASRGGDVVSRDELVAEVWGPRRAANVESLRHYIRYLRQKIEDDPTRPSIIVNDRGVGYRLAEGSRAAGRVAEADAKSA